MATETTITIHVMDYATGERIGSTTMLEREWDRYADAGHPAYQWPEGIARAGDVLSREQLRECGADRDTTIYLA